MVHVQDNGLGIPLEAQSSIVRNVFLQVGPKYRAVTRRFGHRGLTLVRPASSRCMAAVVDVKSEVLGKAVSSPFEFPVQTEFSYNCRSELPSQSMVADTKQRILVVDDNVDAAESLSMMLKIMGIEVRTAPMARQPSKSQMSIVPMHPTRYWHAEAQRYEACRRIRKQAWARDVVIIAQTGWGTDEDKAKSQKAGFDFHNKSRWIPQY